MTQPNPNILEQLAKYSWNTQTPEESLNLAAEARSLDGLARSEADGGFYLATRYADVVAVEDDPATFSSAPSVFRPIANVPPFQALEMDPPQHEVWRAVFRELVNPRTVKKLEPQILADVNRHIDAFIGSGHADLVRDLAEYVPVETICRVGGVQDMDVANEIRLKAAAALDLAGVDPMAFPVKIAEFGAYILPLVEERRSNPSDDFLSHIGSVQIEGAPLSDQSIVGVLFGLFAAGHHSTTTAMASLFHNVFSRPEVEQALRADPKLIPIAVEESLRLDPPFYGFFRRTTQSTTLSGTHLAAEETVGLNWASANRDPEVFDQPEQFRLDRLRNKHIAFGYGIHTCVGAPLARLEMRSHSNKC